MKDCQFGVSPVNYSDSDSDSDVCDKLEDEFHFLFECQLYANLRIKYIKRYYWNRPNMLKLKELMTSTNVKEIKYLGTFVEKAFKVLE